MRKHHCALARRARAGILRVAVLAAAMFAGHAFAADGDLDPSFGSGGFTLTGVTTANFSLPPKPVVQADGKILLCSELDGNGQTGSDFFVARFNPNGSLDTSFDFDGKVTVDFSSRNDACSAITLQTDGKILLAGTSVDTNTSNSDFAVARLNADGSLDATFGAGTGKTIIPFDVGGTDADIGAAVTLQPDGKILVAGWADTGANGDDFAIVRLLPDGTRDTTFNGTGRVTVGFDFPNALNKTDQADAVMVDGAGRILVGGVAENAANSFDFALARLTPTGQLDSGFDADGRATIGFDLGDSNSDLSYQTILQSDGKIVMVGAADAGSGAQNNDFAIARLMPDGSPDPGFGIGGKVTVPFDLTTNGSDVVTGVVEDSVGRLVLVGAAVYDAMSDFRAAAARLLPDGALDTNFGSFGKKTFDFGGAADLFTGVTLQGTQIVAGGTVTSGAGVDNVIARLQVDLIFANGFD